MRLPRDDSLPSLGGDSLWSLDSNNNPRRKSLVDLISFIRTTGPKTLLPRTEELPAEDTVKKVSDIRSFTDTTMTSK